MSTILSIAFINGHGPKATKVVFLKDTAGNSEWAWISNDIASRLRPGMRLECEQVSRGRVQTTWRNELGEEQMLKTPQVQLFLGGDMRVLKPEMVDRKPINVSFEDDLDEFTAAYDAKRADNAQSATGNEEPF